MPQQLFVNIWQHYKNNAPSAEKINGLLKSEGENIVNDHIALRTFQSPQYGIQAHINYFERYGYILAETYYFEQKNLNAIHLQHFQDQSLPKVFISELILNNQKYSNKFYQVFKEISDSKQQLDYHKHKRWWVPSFTVYNNLKQESEYASWVYAHGLMANHFTILVNELKKFTLRKLVEFIEDNGFQLNHNGGKIKGSKELFLEQASTMADHKEITFKEGNFVIPTCYYEFAQRYIKKNDLFQGFIPENANYIFESTDSSKIKR